MVGCVLRLIERLYLKLTIYVYNYVSNWKLFYFLYKKIIKLRWY